MRLVGLSLRVSGWKGDPGHRWPGRQVIAVVNGAAAGHAEFYLHPGGQALEVGLVEVAEAFRGNGLASILMDALCEAHPNAWVNHGLRTPEGAQWWDRSHDPAPERNIHNRAPGEWASYFQAPRVAADRARNAEWNSFYRLNGHRDAEYRYGQRLEMEFQRHNRSFIRRLDTPRVDPARQDLYAGHLLYLPPGLHRYVHNGSRPAAARAQALLDHIGHGNLPRSGDYTGYWNASAPGAFDDALHAELFQDLPDPRPATHVVFHALPLATEPDGPPQLHQSRETYLQYTGPQDISLDLAGLSWRGTAAPHTVHGVEFDYPVQAAVPADSPQDATAQYNALYDELGMRRTASTADDAPFEDRAEEIRDIADQLMRAVAARSPRPRPPVQGHGQRPSPPPTAPSGPRLR